MPDATELTTTADLKVMLGIGAGTSSDALLALVKAQVEAWAKTFTGRDLLVDTYTEYQDGSGSNQLRTLQRPVISVTSIHSDPARLFDAASLIPASDIIGDARSYALGYVELLTYKYLKGLKSTKIVYTAGYPTIPADLAGAVRSIIAKQFKVASKQLYGEVSHQVGDMNINMSVDTFPKDALQVLNGYRRMDF